MLGRIFQRQGQTLAAWWVLIELIILVSGKAPTEYKSGIFLLVLKRGRRILCLLRNFLGYKNQL